jgi:hypothetical protein
MEQKSIKSTSALMLISGFLGFWEFWHLKPKEHFDLEVWVWFG